MLGQDVLVVAKGVGGAVAPREDEVEETAPESVLPRRLRETIRRAPQRARRAWVHREIRRSIHRVAESD